MDQKIEDHLWKTIQRYDFYIGSTNAKAAFLITFNTALLAGVIIKWHEISRDFFGSAKPESWCFWLGGAAFLILALGSLLSTLLTFYVVSPFLKSPKSAGLYHSTIFFGHVAEHKTPEEFIKVLEKTDLQARVEDLAKQAHIIAKGLNFKFENLKHAIWCIIFIQFPSLIILLSVAAYCAASK